MQDRETQEQIDGYPGNTTESFEDAFGSRDQEAEDCSVEEEETEDIHKVVFIQVPLISGSEQSKESISTLMRELISFNVDHPDDVEIRCASFKPGNHMAMEVKFRKTYTRERILDIIAGMNKMISDFKNTEKKDDE